MVSIVSGSGLGLSNTSKELAGQAGELGTSGFGRADEHVSVNAASGNLVIQQRDEFLVGIGQDVGVVRTYNSQGGWDGDNSDGWRIGFYRRVTALTGTVNTAGSTVTRTDADGLDSIYTYDATSGKYVGKDGSGAFDTLSFAAGAWSWTDGDSGSTESYAETATGSGVFRLTQVTDVEGHAIKVGYDTNGLITTLATWQSGATSASETVTLTYDTATRRLTQVTTTYKNEAGQTATRTRERYEYDAAGRLSVVRTDLSPEDNAITDGRADWVKYGYDAAGRVNLITQTDGSSLAIEYDASGRVSKYTDALGRANTLSYDTTNLKTTLLDSLNQSTTISYDASKRLTGVSGAMLGGASFAESFGYDASGNLSWVKNPAGEQADFAYDALGNLTRRTDAAGNVIENSYDSANRLVAQTLYTTPDPDGVAGAGTASGALKTQYLYEGTTSRRLRFAISPEGRVTEYTYNALGQRSMSNVYTSVLYTAKPAPVLADLVTWSSGLTPSDKSLAQRMEFSYDLRGQLTQSRTYTNAFYSGTTVTFDTPADTRYTYDAFGRLLQSTDALGAVTTYVYDGMDRVIFAQDAKKFITLYQYDDAGNRTLVRQPVSGTSQVQVYDAAGQLVSTMNGSGWQAVWSKNFAGMSTPDYSGLAMPADGVGFVTTPAPAYATLSTGDTATTAYRTILGNRIERFDAGNLFRTAISVPTLATGQLFMVGATNASGSRYHRAVIRDGQLFAQWVDAAGVAQEVQLSSASQPFNAGTTYYVEVETSDAGSVLYVNTGDRSTGFIHRSPTKDWDTARLSISAQTSAGRSVQELRLYSVDEVRYAVAGTVLYDQSFDTSKAGLSGFPMANSLFTQSQSGLRIDSRQANLANAEQVITGDAIYGSGDAGTAGKVLFRSELVTSAAATGRNLRIGAASTATGTAARALTARFIDGDLFAEYRNAADGTWVQVKLSSPNKLVKDNQAYVIEVNALAAGGALLNIYEKGTSVGATGSFTYTLSQDVWADARFTMSAFGDAARTSAVMTLARVQEVQTLAVTAAVKTVFAYDKLGRLRISTDGSGQRSHVLYDPAGRKVADIDGTGRLVEYIYDGAGRQLQSIEYATRLTTTQLATLVDGAGAPLEVALATLRPAANAADRIVTSYYDKAGRLIGRRDADGYLTETHYDGASRVLDTIAYAGTGSVVRLDTSAGSTIALPPAMVRPTLDATNDRTTRFFYSADGLLLGTLDADGYLSEFEYDAAGRKIAETRHYTLTDPTKRSGALAAMVPAKNLLDRRSIFLYDNVGRLKGDLDAEGYLTAYLYDGNNRLTSTTRYLGTARLTVSLDASSVLQYLGASGLTLAGLKPTTDTRLEQSTRTYTVRGELDTETSTTGVITKHEYDGNGRLTALREDTAGDRRDTLFAYNGAGLVTSHTNGEGKADLSAYDAAGRVINTTDARGYKTFYYYDEAGRLRYTIARMELGGEVVENTYNAFGEVEKTTAYTARLSTTDSAALTGGLATAALATKVTALANAAKDEVHTRYYTKRGLITQAIDALGAKTDYAYTAFGQLRQSLTDIGDGRRTQADLSYDRRGNQLATVIDAAALNLRTSTEYDAFGRITAQVDGRGNRVTTQYLKNDGTADSGRKVVVTDASLVGRTTVYDAQDRTVLATDGLGNSTKFVHDALARKMTMTSAEGFVTVTEYNSHGEIWKLTDPTGGVTTYAYDHNGRLLTTTDAVGDVTQNTYDNNGNLTKVVGGLKSNGASAPTNDGSAVATQYTYDARNRVLTRTLDPTGVNSITGYTYDGQGRKVKLTDANGIVTSYAFNALGQLTDTVVDDVTGGLQLKTSSTYDAQGRTLTVIEGAGTAAGKTTQYVYDVAGRRTQQVVDPAGLKLTTTYEYDKAGNVVLQRDPLAHGTRYVYDTNNRLKYTIDATGAVTQRLYDAEGRLTGTKAFAKRLADNSAARIWMQPGTNSSVSATLGRFLAGDVVTATVRFKAETTIAGQIFLGDAGGADPYDNSVQTISYGTRSADGWQTMTVTRTMSHDDDMWVYLYGDRDGATATSGDSVLYDNLVITSTKKGTVLNEGFETTAAIGNGPTWSVSGPMGQKTQTDIDLSTTGRTDAQIETAVAALATAGDHLTQIAYDKDDRQRYVIDAEGGVTESRYDNAGRVIETVRYATAFAGTWTATSAPTVDATHDQHTYTVYDAAGRTRYSVDAADYVTETVYDRGDRVTTTKQYAKPVTRPAVMDVAGMTTAVAGKLDAANDRTQFFVYDTAGRQRFSIDAEGYATERQYDALGQVTRTLQYGNKLAYTTLPTLATITAALRKTATFDTDLAGYTGAAGVWDAGRMKLISQPDVGGSWTQLNSPNDLLPGSSVKFELTPNDLQQALHAGVETRAGTYSRLVTLWQPDGHVYVQTYDPKADVWRYADLGTYTVGTTYVVEITTSDTGATAYVYAKGAARENGYIYRAEPNFAWTTLDIMFAAQRYPALTGTTTAYIDNVEERNATVSSNLYDAAGRLSASVDAEGAVTRYTYDAAGRVTQVTEAAGLPEASTTRKVYDAAGRLVEQTVGYGASEAATTRYRYDADGRLVAQTDPRGVAAAAAPGLSAADQALALDHYTTRYGYDALGHRTAVIDALGGVATTDYDVFGNAVKVTDPRGNSGYTYYDRRNLVTLFVDPEGFAVASGYDAFGNKTGTTQYYNRATGSWSAATKPTLTADAARDSTVALQYDKRNLLTQRTDAELTFGTSTKLFETYGYDAFGNRNAWRNKAGGSYSYTFDRRGLQVTETQPITTKTTGGSVIAVVNRNVYDARGNRIRFIEAEGAAEQRSTTYRYDALNRVLDSRGDAVTTWGIGPGFTAGVVPTTTSRYDARGNLIAETDANGNRSAYYYDALDRRIGEVTPDGTLTTWAYDPAGNAIDQKIYGDPVALPAGSTLPAPVNAANVRETQFTYDANNRQIESRMVGLTLGRVNETTGNYEQGALYGLDKVVLVKQYDAAGNLIRQVDGNGGVTYSFYDRDGQKILEVDPDGYGIAWTRGVNGTTKRETRFALRSPTAVTTASDPAALVAAWTTTASDRITDFVYDRDFRLTSESRLNVAYGSVNAGTGALTEATASATKTYAYDGLDKKIRQVDANGAQSDWLYDSMGRLKNQQLPGFTDYLGTAVRSSTDFEYDGLGNILRTIQRGKDGTTEADDEITRFTYGALGRLSTQTDSNNQVTLFEYDAVGNITLKHQDRKNADGTVVSEGTAHVYDAMGRESMHQLVTLASAGWIYGDKTETRYNAWGEITGHRTNGGNAAGEWQEFAEYNALGKVVKTNSGSGITKAYVYDANGNATLTIESAGANLRPLSIDDILKRTDVTTTITIYDKRNLVSQVRQEKMNSSHEVGQVQQFSAQQVSYAPGGGGQISPVGTLLSTTPGGSAPPPQLTDVQRFQPVTSSVAWTADGTDNGEGGYTWSSTHLNSVTVGLSVPSIGAYLGAWTQVRVRVDYRVSGATNLSGSRDVVVTDRNANAATVGLGLVTGVGNVSFQYTVTVTYEYLSGPALTVASAQFGGALAYETSVQVSDGEGGYNTAVQQNFAAAGAFNGSFKTNDLAAFASVVPSAAFSVWQDRNAGDLSSTTVSWNQQASSGESGYDQIVLNGFTVNLPVASFVQTFGGFSSITVKVTYDFASAPSTVVSATLTNPSATSTYIPVNRTVAAGNVNFSYKVELIYNTVPGQHITVAAPGVLSQQIAWVTQTPDGEGGYINTQNFAASNAFDRGYYADTSNKTFFSGGSELTAADDAYLYYRTSASAAYTGVKLSRASTALSDTNPAPATPASGIFYAWNSWIPSGVVDYKVVVMKAGALVGSFNGTSIAATGGLASVSRAQVGQVFFDTYPAIHFFDQGTPRLAIQYRRTGTADGWQQVEVGAYKSGGWFSWAWQAAGLSGAYDMRVLRMDAGGNVTSRMFTQLNLNGTPTATALSPYTESSLSLGSQPANARTMTFWYRPAGSGAAFVPTTFTYRGNGIFDRDFSLDNLLPTANPGNAFDYEYSYEARDDGGQVVNSATGTFRVTPTDKFFVSHTPTRLPTLVSFSVDTPDAVYMDIVYRPLGSTGGFTSVPRLSRAGVAQPFKWDASAITPASGSASYEYQYRLYTSNGQPALNPLGQAIMVTGQTTVGDAPSQAAVSGWKITGVLSATNTIVRRQTHDAFGEVDTETDGRGFVTNSFYNTLGSLVLHQDPLTDVTGENGVTTRARPETRYYYDREGRAVGTRDANGFLTTQTWVDGLGEAKVAKVFLPEAGNITVNSYDVFGNLRISQDGEGRQTRYTYDLKNQLTRLDRPTRASGQYLAGQASWETYEYDSAGNRIATTNVLGRARTYYDLAGRVSKVTSIEGRDTGYAYSWDATITGAGGAQVGGFTTITTMIGGLVSRENKDVFNRMTWRQDYGAHAYSFSYNYAGWLVAQTSVQNGQALQNLSYEYYANGYLKRQTDNVYQTISDYAYDDNGNRIYESYKQNNVVYAQSNATYDELNRVKTVDDEKYRISYKYDAVGNRRNVYSYYNDGLDNNWLEKSYWYLYDSLNRFTVTMGTLANGVITRGNEGKLIGYNRASERVSAEYKNPDAPTGTTVYRERYVYTSDGYLQDMFLSTSTNGSAFVEQSQAASTRNTDLAGRVLGYAERNSDNSVRTNLSRTFDRDNWQLTEVDATQVYNGSSKTDTYGYNTDGTLKQIVTTGVQTGMTRSFAYQWWDSGKQTELHVQANGGPDGWAPGASRLSYDVNGNLYRATDMTGKRTIQYVTDADGQILYRQEMVARSGVGSDWNGVEVVAGDAQRRRSYYYLNGHRIGDVNNDNRTPSTTDYAVSLAQAKSVSNDQSNTKFTPTSHANFDENYQPINDAYPGTAPTDYTVSEGDTLSSIAARIWGDRAMWYLIADANGLSGVETLSAGMRLVIPNKVANIHNNAGTFKVYDAGEAIGDVSPTLPPPPPPPDRDCGGIGTIIMVAIAVVVSIYTAGAATALIGAALGSGAAAAGVAAVAGAAIGAAAGSIASQGFAVAVGMQDSISWKAVGQSALAGGLTAGVGLTGLGDSFAQAVGSQAGSWVSASANAAMSTGAQLALKGDWSWKQVAGAAVVGAFSGDSKAGDLAGVVSNIGGRFVGNWLSNRITQGQGNAHSAWVNAIGSSLGDAAATYTGAADAGAAVGKKWGGMLRDALSSSSQGPATPPLSPALGRTFADDMAVRKVMNDPYGFMQRTADPSPAEPATPAVLDLDEVQRRWDETGTKPVYDFGDPSIVGGDVTAGATRSGGGSPRGTSRTTRAPIEMSVNQKAADWMDTIGNIDPLGLFPTEAYRDIKEIGALLADAKQQEMLDKVQGALRERLGMRTMPTPEALGSYPGIAQDSDGVARIRYDKADLIDRYTDALRKVGMAQQGVIELDYHTFEIKTIGSRKLTPEQYVAEVEARYQKAYARGVELGEAGYSMLELRYPADMPKQLQVGLFADSYSRSELIDFNKSMGVPEGPGQLISMNRWAYDMTGSGLYVKPDVFIDFGPGKRIWFDGKTSMTEAQGSGRQFSDFFRYTGATKGKVFTGTGSVTVDPPKIKKGK